MQLNKLELEKYYKANGYEITYHNLIGLRDESNPGKWNDFLGFWRVDGLTQLYIGTTDPGRKYTFNPLNKEGCFHLATGFHKDMFKVGKHKGYDALVQANKARGWRDYNQNFVNDDYKDIKYGTGVNFHHAHTSKLFDWIMGYSAGCQVIQDYKDWLHFYHLVVNSNQKLFNYLIIDLKEARRLNLC